MNNEEFERLSEEIYLESDIQWNLIKLTKIISEDIKNKRLDPFAEGWFYFENGNKKIKSISKSNTKIKGIARRLIDNKIKITDIAKHYGLNVSNSLATCPFHNDTAPSLSFNNTKNVFHCFGCNVGGDIIEFKRRMMELKNGN